MSSVIFCVSDEQAERGELPAEPRLAESYDRVRTLGRALPKDAIRAYALDAHLAFWNAREGFKIIFPYLDEIRGLSRVDAAAIERIPDLAMGLLHSIRLISLINPPKSDVAERLSQARRYRYVFLHQAQAAAGMGLVPEEVVERIQKGKGFIDAVEDLIALATFFEQHREALRGKSVVSDELIVEAERLGKSLLEDLRPKDAKVPPEKKAEELAQAIDDRNRIATLLVNAYAELQRAAAYLGLEVPALNARRRAKKKADDSKKVE